MSTRHEQTYFTKQEAANYLRLSPRSIDYDREKGELKAYQVGRKLIFTREFLDAFVRRRTAGADLDAIVDQVMAEVGHAHSE